MLLICTPAHHHSFLLYSHSLTHSLDVSLTHPPTHSFTHSFTRCPQGLVMLHLLGALDDKGAVTSPVGAGMALYPLDPSLSRMLVEATR